VNVNSVLTDSDFISRNELLTSGASCSPFVTCDVDFQRRQATLNVSWRWQGARLLLESGITGIYVDDDNRSQARTGLERIGEAEAYTNLQLLARYSLTPHWEQQASISRAIRLPTSYELFGDRGFQTGNEDLLPEEAINVDWSLSYAYRKQKGRVGLFYRNVDDLIVPFVNRGVISYFNTNDAIIYGVELGLSMPLSNRLAVHYDGSALDSEIQSESGLFDGAKVAGSYHLNHILSFDYIYSYFRYQLSYLFSDVFFYDRSNVDNAGEKTSLDASVQFRRGRYQVNAEVKNILDDQYFDFDQVPSQGRSYLFSFKYSFSK